MSEHAPPGDKLRAHQAKSRMTCSEQQMREHTGHARVIRATSSRQRRWWTCPQLGQARSCPRLIASQHSGQTMSVPPDASLATRLHASALGAARLSTLAACAMSRSQPLLAAAQGTSFTVQVRNAAFQSIARCQIGCMTWLRTLAVPWNCRPSRPVSQFREPGPVFERGVYECAGFA